MWSTPQPLSSVTMPYRNSGLLAVPSTLQPLPSFRVISALPIVWKDPALSPWKTLHLQDLFKPHPLLRCAPNTPHLLSLWAALSPTCSLCYLLTQRTTHLVISCALVPSSPFSPLPLFSLPQSPNPSFSENVSSSGTWIFSYMFSDLSLDPRTGPGR